MEQSLFLKSLKFFFKDLIGDVFYFPIWWYTKGLAKGWRSLGNNLRHANENMALTLWAKNIFTPMFGQTDWQGRLVSLFVRLAMVVIRFIGFCFLAVFYAFVFLIRLIFPIFVLMMILANLGLPVFK
ncbi:MAG TPA: hypothetical protein VMX18_02210 [Candidatus Bipolaricaulota bacterium]|nr:hypothetical protein [Candidatus Bipolaricaulota bacterium]